MSQQNRLQHGQNDAHALRTRSSIPQEQVSKDRSSEINMASALPLSDASVSPFISLSQDHGIYPLVPMFDRDGDFINAVSSADSGFLTSAASQYWHRDNDSPWVPISIAHVANNVTSHPMNGNIKHPGMVPFLTSRQTVNRGPNDGFSRYREPPASIPESLNSPVQAHHPFQGGPPHRGTRSAISTNQGDGFGDDGSMSGEVMHATMGMSLNQNTSSSVNNDALSSFTTEGEAYMPRPLIADPPATLLMEQTRRVQDRTAKSKPFFCDYPNCERTLGFTSDSDLDRHKKTKHRIPSLRRPNRSWQCKACQVDGRGRNNTRIWVRLDNFRDHCRKSHKDHELSELMARSELPEHGTAIAEHSNEPESHTLAERYLPHGSDMDVESTASLPGLSNQDDEQNFQSAKGKAPMREEDTNFMLQSGEHWNTLFEVAQPRHFSVTSQPTDYNAMAIDEVKFRRHPTPSLFTNSNASARIEDMRVTGPETNPESIGEESERTFSASELDSFSTHLVEELTKKLNFDRFATEQARLVVAGVLEQLRQGELDANEDLEGASTHESSSTAGSALIPGQEDAKKHPCDYPGCGRAFHRLSELTKHAKRHTRPWTCIWPDCTTKKSWGSKADWKRHEGTVHWSRETFRCTEETAAHERCTKEFARGDQYKNHLKADHRITDAAHLKSRLLQDRQVNPLPIAYGCGFCDTIIQVSSDTEEAWNSRFEHIEGHFKEGKVRDHWIGQTPIISDLNFEGGSTNQGLSQRHPAFVQDGSSHGANISNTIDTTSGPSTKNIRIRNRSTTEDAKRLRAEGPDDDVYSIASSSISQTNTRYHQYGRLT